MYSRTIAHVELMFLLIKPTLNKVYFTLLYFTLGLVYSQILYENTQIVVLRGVGFIHTQLASSHTNAVLQLASSPSTVDFIIRNFHPLISREHSQTN